MVRYIKENFFVRYASFESLEHLNRLAEHWLRTGADQRLHGTVREVVAGRFLREIQELDTSPPSGLSFVEREEIVCLPGTPRRGEDPLGHFPGGKAVEAGYRGCKFFRKKVDRFYPENMTLFFPLDNSTG